MSEASTPPAGAKSNLPSFDELATAKLEELLALPADVLLTLQNEVAEAAVMVAHDAKVWKKVIDEIMRNDSDVEQLFREKGDTGTVHIDRDGHDIVANRPKNVTWSQAHLEKVYNNIVACNDDPTPYIKRTITYTVDENAYKGWSDAIKAAFEAGRSVKPGATTYKINPPKKES